MKLYDIMQYLFRVWMLLGLVLVVSCGIESEKEGPTPEQIETTTDDEADADTSDPESEYAEMSLCSVTIRFVFEHGEGVEVQFENGNDATAIVEIDNDTTGGVVVENCLWPDGEDNEPASFEKGQQLYVAVSLGEGDLLQYSCSELLGDLFDVFTLCDETVVVIN